MPPIIRVENLGKKYAIQPERPERYAALRDLLTQQVKKLFSFPKALRAPNPTARYEAFWALKDLNFEVQPGDCVGIIGRNGAGKSTLLKILSRITAPTTGRVELKGRVASLLEVGTGFHPELTGRENIFLNGAILGMSRAEIRRRFDEIVDFSGVEQFLNTPVKRYSSGMQVRLAFAVAAHLEPEILVVDEILAVGDAEFQKKCLGKMEEVRAKAGRTVLFVSHDLSAVQRLCAKSILLHQGKMELSDFTGKVIEQYLQRHSGNQAPQSAQQWGCLEIRPVICTPDVLRSGEDVTIRITIKAHTSCKIFDGALLIYTFSGIRAAIADLHAAMGNKELAAQEELSILVALRQMNLIEGSYDIGIYLQTDHKTGDLYQLGAFQVESAAEDTFSPTRFQPKYRGIINLNYQLSRE